MKPKILLSLNSKRENYIDAVNNCGGIAVPRYCPDVSTEYDGLILCGGNDIDPMYYNEEMNGTVDVDVRRDVAEFALIEAFAAKRKPIMGICRGCQILNVAFGGNLYQDISNAREHSSFSDYDLIHKVTVGESSFLYDLYGAEFHVNSFHHQAVKKPGKDFDITAFADDGLTVEAIAHRNLPIFGVQWHPERMCFRQKREDTIDGAKIFTHFIKMCAEI